MRGEDRLAWGVLLLVVLPLSFWAMAPALDGGFLNWDDDVYVTGNPLIADIAPSGIGAMFSTLHAGHYFPLVLLSYGIDYRCAGLDPAVYHGTNLLLHLAAVVSVFVFVLLLTGSGPAALLCALLFGIHPAHAESVAWIAERKDTLYAPFFFLSLSAWLLWLKEAKRRWYVLSLVLFAASIGSKAMAMTLPLVLLLIDREKGLRVNPRTLLSKLPFLLLAIASAILTLAAREGFVAQLREQPYRLADLPVSLYRVIFVHLGEILLPAGLFPLLPNRAAHLPAGLSPAFLAGTATVMCALLLPALLHAARRRRPWAFGPLFFLITILPVLRITAPGYFADRYTYATSVGIFLLAAHLAGRIWNAPAGRSLLRPLLVLLLATTVVVFPLEARTRARSWADGVSLWGRAIRLYPAVPDAYFLRGELLLGRGEPGDAVSDLSTAERLGYPPGALQELRATALMALGEDEAALRDLDTVLLLRPNHLPALRNRAILRLRRGDAQGAMQDARATSGIAPLPGGFPPGQAPR